MTNLTYFHFSIKEIMDYAIDRSEMFGVRLITENEDVIFEYV